jgi:nicotinamidase-related amidase
MSSEALIVIDMQQASVSGNDKYDIAAVVQRINGLSARVRARGGRVVFIQHDGTADEGLEPFSDGWQIASRLTTDPDDLTVRKTLNDSFANSSLSSVLDATGVTSLIIAGWATDFCVDATIRSAVSRQFDVAVASDGHTLNDRPHLTAEQVIVHHNWVWSNLISSKSIRVEPAEFL